MAELLKFYLLIWYTSMFICSTNLPLDLAYITIANSQAFHLQLLGMHWPTHTYLLTITIVISLVHYLFLALTIAQVAHTIIYLHIYFMYLLWHLYCIILSQLQTWHFSRPPLVHLQSSPHGPVHVDYWDTVLVQSWWSPGGVRGVAVSKFN